eukprot:255340-Pyramimonas_sp.AAC.1
MSVSVASLSPQEVSDPLPSSHRGVVRGRGFVSLALVAGGALWRIQPSGAMLGTRVIACFFAALRAAEHIFRPRA